MLFGIAGGLVGALMVVVLNLTVAGWAAMCVSWVIGMLGIARHNIGKGRRS